jgi:hypothetical protein
MKSLAAVTSAQLTKRVRIHNTIMGTVFKSIKIDGVISFEVFQTPDGLYQLRGEIDTGEGGRELSWRLPGIIDVQVDELHSFRQT